MYRVIKALNNNSILALDENGGETIILGNGIGFGKKPNDRIDVPDGAKIYSIVNKKGGKPAINTVNSIPAEFLEITGRIISLAQDKFATVNRDVFFPLADHIAFAVKRLKEGMPIENPLTPEIRLLFPEEYGIALEGRRIINEFSGCNINDDEVGFITLHIHSALADENVSDSIKITMHVKATVEYIQKAVGLKIDEDSLAYNRLVSHVRYMIMRSLNNEELNIDILEYVRTNFPKSCEIAEGACSMLERELKVRFSEREVGFLGIHIQRVM